MTLTDLKKLFRKFIVVVAGGPTDKTRGVGLLAIFDALAEELDGKGSATVQAQHSQQLATLAARAANLYAHYADNTVAPFNTLDDFLAAAGLHGGTLRLEGEATALSITASNRGNWPAFWDAAGATIVVPTGAALTSSAAGAANLSFSNFYLTGGGTFALSGQLAQTTPAGQASLLLNGQCLLPLDNPAGVVTLDGGYYKKITGAGKYYLAGTVQVDDMSGATNVVDLRGGGGGAPVDAYTKGQSDARFLKSTARDADYTELTPDSATAIATWAVDGKLEAQAFLNLAGATTLAIAGAANGWGGTLRLWNTSNGPLALTLPAGSFGPKNYNATLAAGERRFLAFEKVAGELFFNSGLYYPL